MRPADVHLATAGGALELPGRRLPAVRAEIHLVVRGQHASAVGALAGGGRLRLHLQGEMGRRDLPARGLARGLLFVLRILHAERRRWRRRVCLVAPQKALGGEAGEAELRGGGMAEQRGGWGLVAPPPPYVGPPYSRCRY